MQGLSVQRSRFARRVCVCIPICPSSSSFTSNLLERDQLLATHRILHLQVATSSNDLVHLQTGEHSERINGSGKCGERHRVRVVGRAGVRASRVLGRWSGVEGNEARTRHTWVTSPVCAAQISASGNAASSFLPAATRGVCKNIR